MPYQKDRFLTIVGPQGRLSAMAVQQFLDTVPHQPLTVVGEALAGDKTIVYLSPSESGEWGDDLHNIMTEMLVERFYPLGVEFSDGNHIKESLLEKAMVRCLAKPFARLKQFPG